MGNPRQTPTRQTPARRAAQAPVEPPAEPAAPQAPSVDAVRVAGRLANTVAAREHELAVAYIRIEDLEELVSGLQAELVEVSSRQAPAEG